MSFFSGTLREYPSILVDCFTKDAQAYFLSHCHKDHMDGLDTPSLTKRLQSSQNLFIYCSETTKNLLMTMCNQSYAHLKEYIRDIPVDQPELVALHNESTGQQENLLVTLLPAGHCVGSVMFLFEGDKGNVLYTGDFRLAKGDAKRLTHIHSNGRVKDIKSVYVDTTFCLPKMMSIPSREETRDAIVGLIDKWFSRGSGHVVSLLCKGMYGYEFLLKEIAIHYKTKIHVSEERLALYRYLVDMTPHFTTDAKETRIHACVWKRDKICRADLPCTESFNSAQKLRVLRIKPSTLWFSRLKEPLPSSCTRYSKDERLWRVVHSMHASMEEIRDLIGYIRPYHVYPTVEPAGLRSLEDAVDSLKDLIRIEECDSCNQEAAADVMFREAATEFEKTDDIEDNVIKRPVPSDKVMALCKELGLNNEPSLNAPPIKRKRNEKRHNHESAAESGNTGSTQEVAHLRTEAHSSFSLSVDIHGEAEISDRKETEASGYAGSDCVRGITFKPEQAESICDAPRTPGFAGRVDEVVTVKERPESCSYSTSEVLECNSEASRVGESSGQITDSKSNIRPKCNVELLWNEVGHKNGHLKNHRKIKESSGKLNDVKVRSASEGQLCGGGSCKNDDALAGAGLNKESAAEFCSMEEFDEKSGKKLFLLEGGFGDSANEVTKYFSTVQESKAVLSEQRTSKDFLLAKSSNSDGDCEHESAQRTVKEDSQRPCSQGNDFDVPPSPGHTQPSPGTLCLLHQRLVSGPQLSNKSLRF